MQTKFMAPVLDIKSLTDDGTIRGYGSIFGNKDSGGDIVMPGAFGKSLAEHRQRGTTIKMLWQHDSHQPIGKWIDFGEDGKGLYVEGRLNMGVQKAREAHALLKEGDIEGLSIGYAVVSSEPDQKRGAVLLKEVKLYEVSIVTMAMNERARVDAVKADYLATIAAAANWQRLEAFFKALRDGAPPPVKEYEAILREAVCPKSMATQIASVGYVEAIRREADGTKADDPADFLKALLSAR